MQNITLCKSVIFTSNEAKYIEHRWAFPPGGHCLVAVQEQQWGSHNTENHRSSREGKSGIKTTQRKTGVLISCILIQNVTNDKDQINRGYLSMAYVGDRNLKWPQILGFLGT